ncbi:MAG: PDZ domain-containing protein [Ignavibacteriaceae bacterium]|nr:PDZ domain-containing protein [Ignavibacteriaceae bacterium]
MKKLFLTISILITSIANPLAAEFPGKSIRVVYNVDLTNYQDDLFHITVFVNGLSKEEDIFNLPATVPGTYSILDFGRYVKFLSAFDKDGNELTAKKISTNQWQVSNADKLAKLVYDVEDTFDSDNTENKVIPMAGTSINNEFILLNTFALLGYFEGHQSDSIRIKIDYKSDWTLGTSLTKDENGYFVAETYDHLADSPFLIGNLSTSSTTVNDIKVGMYVYSPDTTFNAANILKVADKILKSSAKFIGYSPVTHYNFLMVFLGKEDFLKNGFLGAGALEHSYSSLFVFPASQDLAGEIQDDIAHEFLHILTPLNLHSDIIEPFNFEIPTSSEHIWLYEGITEWASDIMQLRGGIITAEEYLERISEKAKINERFNQNISLTALSQNVYSEEITMQFLNFYNKGAITAALLDIRLLELSNGKRGLREVFLELLNKYGKSRPFSEKNFFNEFINITYPEIEMFIADYIIGTEPLPLNKYFAKLGYDYIYEQVSADAHPSLGLQMGMNNNQEFAIAGLSEECKNAGLAVGDVVIKVFGEEVNMQSIQNLFGRIYSMHVGDIVEITVRRDGNEISASVPLKQKMDKHVFREMEQITDEQKQLREAWLKNL